MTSGRSRRTATALIAASLLLTGCWFGGDDDTEDVPTTTAATQPEDADPIVTIDDPVAPPPAAELGVQLGEGTPADSEEQGTALVEGEPLAPSDVDALIDRLPAWDLPDDDRSPFERPAETLPPPTAGTTIDAAFPPPGDADDPTPPAVGPLEVVRFQPDGPVDVAPFVTVTFDQPMVPVGTFDDLESADVPVRMQPEVDGRWRWVGTQTLRFEVEPGDTDRLPAATKYDLVVPAGTTSAIGGTLGADVAWSFTTPPPSVERFVGVETSTDLSPVFVAVFDQIVDPAAALPSITMETFAGDVSLRLATDAEVDADERASDAVEQALPGRAVAFTPVAPLVNDASFVITVGPGTPSLEGPLTSQSPEVYEGRTFGSLQIADVRCGFGDGCVPGTPMVIEFNNALDTSAFDAEFVTVEPQIAGLSINVSGNVIELVGATVGRTTYTVRLDGRLTDEFGQQLGDDEFVEFDVVAAPPALGGLPRSWMTIDPTAETPQVSVATINHDSVRVRAWAVTPAQLGEFQEYQEALWSDPNAPDPEWTVVFDEVVDIDTRPDTWIETPVDLESAFAQSGSQLVVRVDPTMEISRSDDDYWRNQPSLAWVQSTTLGIDAFFDRGHLVIWTTDLATGEPVEGVPVELIGDGRLATTDDEGLAELELGETGVLGLWAIDGDRTSLLPAPYWMDGWSGSDATDETRWYVFDDRGIYRPGETVRITGWVRNLSAEDGHQLRFVGDEVRVRYQAWDAQGSELTAGDVELNALGGFNVAIELPEGANLGQAWVEFELVGTDLREVNGGHGFSVQEFRRPDFEVSTTPESPGPYHVAEPVTVRVDASSFTGGPVAAAPVDWLVSTRETTYRPPNWDDFSFGVWIPWWGYGVGDDLAAADIALEPCFDCGPGFDVEFEQFSGTTDAAGSHFLEIDFDGDGVDLPTTVTAEATVTDVDRQALAGRSDLLVHAADHYVGLRSDRAFVRQGTPLRIDAVVTDVDGGTVPGQDVTVTAGRLEWVTVDGTWTEQLVDEQTCEFTSSGDVADGSMRCEFTTDTGGTYEITAIVRDDRGGTNRTELTQWVSGGSTPPTRSVDLGNVQIIPDRETYEPGDTAELLVQAPFAPAHGTVLVLRGDIESTFAFAAEDGSAIVEIPIDDALIPGVDVHVEMVGTAERLDDDGNPVPEVPPQPAFAAGQIALSIPPTTRALDVAAVPAAAELAPGADTEVTVTVTDADGQPVADADVAVLVVDEAVLSLTGYELADPLDVFYQPIWSPYTAERMRSSVVLTRSDLVTADGDELADLSTPSADGGLATADSDAIEESGDDALADGGDRNSLQPVDATSIEVRSDFDPLAVYEPSTPTGADGSVTVAVPLPDSTTRYRVMAVAVNGEDQFGKGESTITARLPLQVSPSPPRFLNFGDEAELPVVLANQTDDDIEVDVAIELSNLRPAGPTGQRVTVPANDRIEIRFPVTTDDVGTARFRVVAVGAEFADAAEGDMPVYTPATSEAFATYGQIDEGAISQPILAPTGVWPQFGGLEVNTSSTALQALTDAVLYLNDYRYESADGLASRIMAVATLRDVLDAFDADGLPDPDELNAAVRRDLDALVALQNDDGGFPSWQRGRPSVPWTSIQSTQALVLADQAGYVVPDETLRAALEHLAVIEDFIPADQSDGVRDTLSAYALAVRAEAGQPDPRKATALYDERGDELQLDALAWLWPSITDIERRDAIERSIGNGAVETAGAATFATSYAEDAYVIAQSDTKTDGIILDALITQTPESDLIPKVVNGLLGAQQQGRWNNAHENAFVLIAMNRYFDTFESVTPDFVARTWLGDLFVAEHEFRERTTKQITTLVPMDQVVSSGDAPLVIAKDGDGRLYYRIGLRYAPTDLELDPRDEGFVVERTYTAVDDPDDVRRNDDGTWTIRAGATVRVSLTMVADARRTNVALVDPMPAGLEPLNPTLALTPTVPPDESVDVVGSSRDVTSWGNWFGHQNLRDDRAEAFASSLAGGTYEYSYTARATTPGTFVVPPARAEEIFAPEVFGRSASEVVVVE